MNIFNRRIGRTGFALGYLPVLAIIFAIVRASGYQRWYVDSDPKRLALFVTVLLWTVCFTAWRGHDFGKSAWSNFWTEQVPFIGPIVGLWDLLTNPGDPGQNAYGPAPKL